MTTSTLNYRFKVRGGTAAAAASLNEILLDREWFIETDTGRAKQGNGVTAYNSLPYLSKPVLWAADTGAADTLAADFSPNSTLADGDLVAVRALHANATTTPTLAVDGTTARTITKFGGQALAAGDIYGAGHELLLRYRSSVPRWELLNPAASGGGSVPTGTGFRHVTSGSEDAAAVTIDGISAAAGGDVKVLAPATHAATSKATPVDADELPLVDSAASNVLKKLTWANLKATLKTYFDTLYVSGSGGTSAYPVYTTTWNPSDIGTGGALSGGNLTYTRSAAGDAHTAVRATTSRGKGKWYFEVEVTAAGASNFNFVGLAAPTMPLSGSYPGESAYYGTGYYGNDGRIYLGGVWGVSLGTFTTGDVIGVAFDADNGWVYFSKNGTFLNSASPSTNLLANAIVTMSGVHPTITCFKGSSAATLKGRFARAAMGYTIPTGFAPWDND